VFESLFSKAIYVCEISCKITTLWLNILKGDYAKRTRVYQNKVEHKFSCADRWFAKNTNFRKSYTAVIQHIKDAENAVFAKICVICVQNTLLRQPPE
jgi:hypothetical protein